MSDGTIFVLSSPYGPLALTSGQLRAAQSLAGDLLAVEPSPKTPSGESGSPETTALIDAAEAGRLLGVPPSWVLQRARENRIPSVRIGKYVRFDPDEVRAFLQNNGDRHANLKETHPQQDSDSKG